MDITTWVEYVFGRGRPVSVWNRVLCLICKLSVCVVMEACDSSEYVGLVRVAEIDSIAFMNMTVGS